MPPTIPASLLKAVQCRHHPLPPFLYCKGRQRLILSHMVSGSQLARNISSGGPRGFLNCSSRTRGDCFVGKGASPAKGWRWMMSVEGDGIQKGAMGSLNRAGEVNGSCKGEEREEEERRSKLLTIPTVLTLGRVAAVPLLVSTFYMNSCWATTATTSIFIAAAVTDWLDGYIARKMQSGSDFGAFLDPVADKLMVAATLVLLCTRQLDAAIFEGVPWLLTVPSIAIIGREITMSAVREWAASQNSKVLEAVAVNSLGKWKTATQMTALTILLIARDSSLSGQDGLFASGVALLYISAGLALWSLAVYIRKIWRVLLK